MIEENSEVEGSSAVEENEEDIEDILAKFLLVNFPPKKRKFSKY